MVITMSGNNNEKKKKYSLREIIICVVFFAALTVLPIITVLLPKESFSQIENKSLSSFPKFSAKTLFDGDYTDRVETYIADHFAGRVSWIGIKSRFEYLVGKREQKNIYILGDRLIEKINEPDYAGVDKNIAAINAFADYNDIPVYMMLVPTSAEFYKNELPSYEPNLDQRGFISYVYGKVNAVDTIDVYQTLQLNRNEYTYYRTDHHWTSEGAFLAYGEAGKKLGYTPVPLSEYDIEHAGNNFLGTFYSKTLYSDITPDTIDLYRRVGDKSANKVYITSEYGKEPAVYDSMYFRDYLDVKDKYSVFFGTNQPIVRIETGNTGKKLLVIKDSYAHCFVPFLTQHYSEITMLDLRYVQLDYRQVIDMSEYDQVLLLYNVSSFADDTNLRKLGYTG